MKIRQSSGWGMTSMSSSSLAKIVGFSTLVFFVLSFVCVADVEGECMCPGEVPCQKNSTSENCPTGRVIFRRDCTCCSVCAKQLTEECNDRDLPCDEDFGLVCGADRRCKADKSCSDDTECSDERFCSGGACADPCKVLQDVCKDAELKNGICVVRNHRALCSCPNGQSVNADKECVSAQPEANHCTKGGRTLEIGQRLYTQKCGKICECQADGDLTCRDVEGSPICPPAFIPMSTITGEMSEACKILVGSEIGFDGCCVPATCKNVTSQDEVKGFELSEAHNNLGDEEETPREMLLMGSTSDIKVDEDVTHSLTTTTTGKNSINPVVNDVKNGSSSETTTDEGEMQITVLSKTAHTAVVKLPVNDKEANLAIALSSQLKRTPDVLDLWKAHRIPFGLPTLILADLLANTSYTVKYSVGDQAYPPVQFQTAESDLEEGGSDKHEMSSDEQTSSSSTEKPKAESSLEEVTTDEPVVIREVHNDDHSHNQTHAQKVNETLPSVETTPVPSTTTSTSATTTPVTTSAPQKVGCTVNGTIFDVGHVTSEGCNDRCECLKNGEMKCVERCSMPFFKKGYFDHDKLCHETPSGNDECCVIVACAQSGHPSGRELTIINPCESVTCGQNAECRHEISPTDIQIENQSQETLCVCKEGFIGDPYDRTRGCESGVTPTLSSATAKPTDSNSSQAKADSCQANNRTYEFGEEYKDGCNYKCHCESSGEFLCRPRCAYRRDEEVEIPKGCVVKKDPSDIECCEMLTCEGDSLDTSLKKDKQTVPTDGCVYKNKTYERDEKFFDGCEQQCMCFSNGDVTCQPRCPPAGPASTLEKECVTLPDPIDSCCTVTICGNSTVISEVMKAAADRAITSTAATTTRTGTTERGRILKDDPISEENSGSEEHKSNKPPTPSLLLKIVTVIPWNETSMMVSVRILEDRMPTLNEEKIVIRYSSDLATWREVEAKVKELFVEGSEELHTIVGGLDPGRKYFFKAEVNGTVSNTVSGFTKGHRDLLSAPESPEVNISGSGEEHSSSLMSGEDPICKYKNKMFGLAEEFYDGCDSYCVCEETGSVQCVPIECPNDFGLELLDNQCVKWEPVLENFQKEPPNCCPEMRCVQNATCTYEGGLIFENFEELPRKLTGCGKRCYCEYGNVTCQNVCPPVGDVPPPSLPCPPSIAVRITLPPENCCQAWVCEGQNNSRPEHFPGHFHPNFPGPHLGPNAADEISGVMIRPLNESTFHIDFTVSPVLVGLQGAVEVLYTREFKTKPNPDQWERQVFQQPEDIIDNSHLQLFLTGLQPASEYHVQIQVMMSDLHNTPTSDIFVVWTPHPATASSTLPPEILVDPKLQLVKVSSNTAEVSWRKLTSFEESLTDGVQVKYKGYDDQFYATSPLIHRSISSYTLTNLHPATKYEVDILFVPFTNQTTELKSENPIHINTPSEVDDYSFTIALTAGKVTEQSAELIWEGVTFPEDKFVNIYQVIYRNDEEKEQKNTFKVAKRELSKKATITDLKPGTKYQIWLEAFLTNGKKKTSNVITVQTKAGTLPAPEKSEQDKLDKASRSQDASQESTSYYGALIALATVAALSIVGIVVLLMILIKKQNQSKIPINDRKSESSYDNPSFKNYDIEANGHSHNKPSEL